VEIFGNVANIPQDVILTGGKEHVGDSLSVHLSQAPGSAAVWRLKVFVHVVEGEFYLGEIVTTPPSVSGIPARTVLIASCPAAMGWKVVASCATAGETADVLLQSSKCCSSAIGVTKVFPDGDPNSDDPWLNTFSTALANTFTILPSAGTVRSITVRLDGTAPSATYYLQVWDAAAVPADGTAVSLTNSLLAPEKLVHVLGTDQSVRIDYNELGVDFDNGAILVLSSTEFTKTLVAGAYLSVSSAEYQVP
jgi:hypothetical protein